MKHLFIAFLFVGFMSPGINATAGTITSETVVKVEEVNPNELVDLCVTYFRSDGSVRRTLTIQLRRSLAERVVARWGDGQSSVLSITFGAC